MKPDLTVFLAGIKMKNPVMTASGTYGFGDAYTDFYALGELGALVVKGVTLEPRRGNPPPRLAETPAGLLNSIGLENPGVEAVLKHYLPGLSQAGTPVIVNIAGNSIDDYVRVAERLHASPVVKALEVNISCPNVKCGGLAFGSEPGMASQVIGAVKRHSRLPVIAKLSPNVTDIGEIALAVEEAGADAISLINTLVGMKIDIKKRRPALANLVGGLSGPAVRPVAVRMVYEVSQKVKVPLIGLGGIITAEDALEFIMAGASAVAVGTGNFINPCCCREIIAGLTAYCETNKIANITALTGAAWRYDDGSC